MKGKIRWYSLLFLGLALLLICPFTGCFGLEVVETELDLYWDATNPIMEEWKIVINDWEESASNPNRLPYLDRDAEAASSKMNDIIVAWDAIEPPDKAKEYHRWIYLAMNYEKEAFRVMRDYYRLGEYSDPEEFDRLSNLAVELWVLKDKALWEANAAFPE